MGDRWLSPVFMIISLFVSRDEKNVINKNLPEPYEIEGHLKGETSITDPIITIDLENPSSYNYAYIQAFGRYYFINDIKSIRNNLWELSMHVDVLMTYKNEIGNCTAIIDTTEETGLNNYLSNDSYKALVKTKTDIVNFPNGLNDDGEYILITAGG